MRAWDAGGGETDPSGDLRVAQPTIGLQQLEDASVRFVETHLYRRSTNGRSAWSMTFGRNGALPKNTMQLASPLAIRSMTMAPCAEGPKKRRCQPVGHRRAAPAFRCPGRRVRPDRLVPARAPDGADHARYSAADGSTRAGGSGRGPGAMTPSSVQYELAGTAEEHGREPLVSALAGEVDRVVVTLVEALAWLGEAVGLGGPGATLVRHRADGAAKGTTERVIAVEDQVVLVRQDTAVESAGRPRRSSGSRPNRARASPATVHRVPASASAWRCPPTSCP